MTPVPGRHRELAVLSCSVLFGFVLFEVGFRISAYFEDSAILTEALKRPPAIPEDRQVGLRNMIRLSPNDRIIYELAPNLSVLFLDRALTTNADGFRDRQYAKAKAPGTVRFVGIGDSVMFGWGVADGEDYLSVLEESLNRELPERPWEVINTAVPGYNTVMEVETLKSKGLAFAPDVVIVGFCGNDMSLPNFVRDKEDYLGLRTSFLWRFVSRRLRRLTDDDWDPDGLLANPQLGPRSGAAPGSRRDPANAPRLYADMVGPAAFVRAMRELAKISAERDFAVVVLFYPGMPREIGTMIRDLGFHLLDPGPAVRRFQREHRLPGYRGSVLTISRRDPHPSPVAHELIARFLLDSLRDRGLLRRSADE